MTVLGGTLDGVGLPAVISFLGGLQKTGCLRIAEDNWRGEIFFEDGQVTGASLGMHRGLSALDALVQALPGASFAFESEARESGGPSIELSRDALDAHLAELAGMAATNTPPVPVLDGVPRMVQQDGADAGEEPLPLDRGTLQTLLAVDGQRTVREIVARRGTFEALWQLASLRAVGLITVTSAPSPRSKPTPLPSVPASVARAAPEPEPQPASMASVDHCPKLGFEDDPSNSFGRPTRLHRCFAAGAPLPLSLDQQRDLCLSDQFGTCPRLKQAEPQTDVSRIVRLPFVARAPAAERGLLADRHAVGERPEPTRFRSSGRPAPIADGGRMTPLRGRLERATAGPPAATVAKAPSTAATPPPARNVPVDSSAAYPSEPPLATPATPRRAAMLDALAERRSGVRPQLLVGGALALALVGLLLLFTLPQLRQMGSLLADDSIDPATLPNAAALANGTPVAQLPLLRPTVAARAVTASSPAPSLATAVPEPTPPVQPTQAQTQPPTAAPQTSSALLDENFADNSRRWPSDPQGTAQLAGGSYRVSPRRIGQFVAIGAPMVDVLQDMLVSATFHKLSGPSGGGYGIVVRDQARAPQNGISQDGQYYVLEVGDKGEVGIWRRDGDHWADLLPWQHADAVKPGTAVNEVSVRASGTRLSLLVNGTEVASRTDAMYASGTAGIFVGGDGNVVSVDKFSVQKL